MDEETRRAIIMDHYMHPFNKIEDVKPDYEKVNTANSSCIDNLDIFVKIENDMIKDLYFNGEACAISTSSASIMVKNLIGKSVENALHYIEEFEKMINEQDYSEEVLEEAIAYQEIYKQNNRKNCAYLPYRGIKEILEQHVKK